MHWETDAIQHPLLTSAIQKERPGKQGGQVFKIHAAPFPSVFGCSRRIMEPQITRPTTLWETATRKQWAKEVSVSFLSMLMRIKMATVSCLSLCSLKQFAYTLGYS